VLGLKSAAPPRCYVCCVSAMCAHVGVCGRYFNDGESQMIKCRNGNIPLNSTSRWGVVLFQTVAFVSNETVTSGRRGLLSVLGSVGGAYSLIFTFFAILYKLLWFWRMRNGWDATVMGGSRGLQELGLEEERSKLAGSGPGVFSDALKSSLRAYPRARPLARSVRGGKFRSARHSLFGLTAPKFFYQA
jgi:hypothetical protein